MTISYRVVQKQKNGRCYLYDATGVWNPVKKNSRQTRTYLGVCGRDGNLLKEPTKNRTISRSPAYGPYRPFTILAERSGLMSATDDVYSERDGRRLLALAILGIVNPATVNRIENTIDDTYLRGMLGAGWGFEQSSVCRFLQSMGHGSERRGLLFRELAPKSGCVIFDIVCLGTDSENLEYSEVGERAHLTGLRQFNPGMVYSMEGHPPFRYRTYSGSVADVSTPGNIVSDLGNMGSSPVELEMDGGFFSIGNVEMMIGRDMGFAMPVLARASISKLLLSESVGDINSPLNTDYPAGSAVRGH